MQLTRRRIIAVAMDLIEAEGVQAATMTRLATELGCGLVPLYIHVPSSSALLDGIAAAIMSRVQVAAVSGGWADQVAAQARTIRQAARVSPRCSVAVAGRTPATAALLRPAERALAALRTAGFGAEDAVQIARAVAAYLAGSLLREAGVAPGPDSDGDGRRPQLRAADFPHVTGLAAELTRADPDGDFEFGLGLLVRGMDTLLAGRSGPL